MQGYPRLLLREASPKPYRSFLSLTEPTELTEFFRQRLKDRWLTLRVPSGFDLSPTDFLTRLLLCSAIRVNSIALAYRNNYTDYSDYFFLDALFDFVKNRATDLHRFFTRCASYIRTSLASARSPTVNPEGVIDYRRGCKPPVEIPPYTNPEGVAERTPSETFCP